MSKATLSPSQQEVKTMDDDTRRVWVVISTANNLGYLTGIRQEGTSNAGQLAFPGGHPEVGESSIAGAQRELHEETGIACQQKDLIKMCVFQRNDVTHEFFELTLLDMDDVIDVGLQDTKELACFRFWHKEDLDQPIVRRFIHKSIKRWLDCMNA
jgi:8-oxo-dGTP pyrophosphatase MutT (NUDIX family)